MLKNWIFWLCFVALIGVLFLIFGCDPEGRRGTRLATCITGGGDGVSHAWLAYEDAAGEELTQPGLRMNRDSDGAYCEYIPPNGHLTREIVSAEWTWVKGGNVTGDDGRLVLSGFRNWEGCEDFSHHVFTAYARYIRPGLSPAGCTRTAIFQSMFISDCGTTTAMTTFESIPRWVNAASATQSNLTLDEVAAVSNAGTNLPENGISYTCQLVQQQGSGGNGHTANVAEGFMAFNLVEPENVFRYASPMMYSYTVKTADSIDLLGDIYQALIKTDVAIDGVPVALTVVAENDEQTVHVARTEWFLPVNPESYEALAVGSDVIEVYDRWTPLDDPNDIGCLDTSDPNFIIHEILDWDRVKPLKLIPIGDEDGSIQIEFTPDICMILKGAASWLTGDKLFDINNDDIVNLKDWHALSSM